MRTNVLLAAAFALLCADLVAQAPGAHWSMTTTATNPPLRRENPGASDGTFMYVFGGTSGTSSGVPLNDLWRFDGVTWTEMTANGAAGSPPARTQSGVTWDPMRGRLVVFGGRDSGGVDLNDSWEWDPNSNIWADVTPAGTSPSARRFTALAYDAVHGKVLMFGGLDAAGAHLNDTWHFDGASWTQMFPVGSIPQVRRQHALVERPEFVDVILCGGQEAGGAGMLGDTWRWDGANWTQIALTTSPVGRVAMDAAYDPIRQRLVIACGNPGPTGVISEYDSLTDEWIHRPLDPGIFKVTRYFAAYLATTGKIYKVSGQALNASTPPQFTYEYQSDILASYTMSGTACAGAVGVPALTINGGPWINEVVSFGVVNVAGSELVILWTGVDTSSYLGFPLPWDLTPFGLTGCTLYVNPLIETDLGLGATGSFTVPLPDDVALGGFTFYNQGIVIDTLGGNVSLTQMATGVIGVK